MIYAEIFKKIRKNKKMNQVIFSHELGITQSYLSSIEKNKLIPSRKILSKLSELANIPVEMLLWFNVKEDDVSYDKQEQFKAIKPAVDSLLMILIEDDFFK